MESDPAMTSELEAVFGFIRETEKLKDVMRVNPVPTGERKENSAEHTFTLALMTVVFRDVVGDIPFDSERALKMALIHDLVEIDAGDTFAYDAEANKDKAERERKAADRIFGLLPGALGAELRELWDEFEEETTPTARYVASLDRIHPMMQHLATEGVTWMEKGITAPMMRRRVALVGETSRDLGDWVESQIRMSVDKGWVRAE